MSFLLGGHLGENWYNIGTLCENSSLNLVAGSDKSMVFRCERERRHYTLTNAVDIFIWIRLK